MNFDVGKYRFRELESDFQLAVMDLARMCGWHVVHFPDSRLVSEGGWPDLSMVRSDGRVILAELKREDGKMSDKQEELGECFGKAEYNVRQLVQTAWGNDFMNEYDVARWGEAFRYFVWRPSDWDSLCAVLMDGREEL